MSTLPPWGEWLRPYYLLTSISFNSQPFWGKMVASAGAGPQPIPQKQLSSESLAQAIKFCLTEGASAAAKAVSLKMKTEFGVQQAVESFHANLPLSRLRCELLRDRPASWLYAKGDKKVRLSKVAAEILVDNGCTTWSRLSRYEPNPICIDVRRWDPASAVVSSLMGTWTGMATSAADIVIEPIKAYQKPKLSANDDPGFSQTHQDQPSSAPSESAMNHRGVSEPLSAASETRNVTPEDSTGSKRFARAALGSASGVGRFFQYVSSVLRTPLSAWLGNHDAPDRAALFPSHVQCTPNRKSTTDIAGQPLLQGNALRHAHGGNRRVTSGTQTLRQGSIGTPTYHGLEVRRGRGGHQFPPGSRWGFYRSYPRAY